MNRYTIREHKYEADTPMARLQELENKIEDGVLVEVVRCENCANSKHWYADKRLCFLWSEAGIGVFNDGYCNYAERKERENGGKAE